MKNLFKVFILFIGIVNLALAQDKLVVSVSVIPQAYFVNKISGGLIDVNIMVDSKNSPETYEPSINQLKDLEKSKLYFLINMPFEKAWINRFKSVNKNIKFIQPMEDNQLENYYKKFGYEEHEDDSHEHIPHIWLSFMLAKNHIRVIANTLKEVDSNNANLYEKNAQSLIEDIDALYTKYKNLFKNKNKSFLVYHPAFEYIANELGIKEYSIEQDGKDAKIGNLRDIFTIIKENNISTIFIQPQFSDKHAMLIAKEAKLDVKVADPLAYDWLENINKILQMIHEN